MFNKVFKIRDEGRSLWKGEESVEGRHTEYHLYLTRHRGVKFNRSSKRHGFPACARACVWTVNVGVEDVVYTLISSVMFT